MPKETAHERDLEEEIEKLRKEIQDLSVMIRKIGEGQAQEARPTGPREEILKLLEAREKPMTVKQIAAEIGLAEATVSGYTLDLHKGGYLERDRQLVTVSPTRRVRQLEYYIPGKKRKKWHYVD